MHSTNRFLLVTHAMAVPADPRTARLTLFLPDHQRAPVLIVDDVFDVMEQQRSRLDRHRWLAAGNCHRLLREHPSKRFLNDVARDILVAGDRAIKLKSS